jgi:hypothetical protein
MPIFKGVKPKPIERLQKKKRPARVKRSAISETAKVQLIKDSANLTKLKIQIQKMKLGTSLIEGKFSEVSKNYDALKFMEESAKVELDYISEIKEGKKANEKITNFEKAVEKFRKDTKIAQNFIERAVSNKLYTLYENVLKYENTNLNKLSDKQREKILTNLANSFNEYQILKSKFSQINFGDAKGIDHRVEKMKKIIESNNRY